MALEVAMDSGVGGELQATRTCLLWEEEAAVRGRFLPKVEVSLEDAKECIQVVSRLARGRRCPIIVDLRAIRSQSAEARAYFAGPEATKVTTAVALLVSSPLSRALGNFYLGFNHPEVPTRLFTDELEAERWLRAFPFMQGEATPSL